MNLTEQYIFSAQDSFVETGDGRGARRDTG